MKAKLSNRTSYTLEAALVFLSDSERKIGHRVLQALLEGRDKDLFKIHVNPQGYADWKDFAVDWQCANLLRKFPALDLGINKADVALEGFLASEDLCARTSVRFYNLLKQTVGDPELYGQLRAARAWCHRILGEFSWDRAVNFCGHGPGSNVGVPRKLSHRWYKIGHKRPTVTSGCLPLLQTLMSWCNLHRPLDFTPVVVKGSKLTTVPKDARKDRTICQEPLWNMFFQKGIGGLIRHCLRRSGLDLNRQQPENQRLAHIGSVTGELVTLDLSAASDSVSMGLVEFLLPDSWVNALKQTRSYVTELPDGSTVFLRKISSMGNGYTFELESLIFLALTLAVFPAAKINQQVAVYGDDIIAPLNGHRSLIRLLDFCGFKTNEEKSFTSGPFRESCGKHYFSGVDVTPLYIRKDVSCPDELFALCNNVRRAASRLGSNLFCDRRWEACYHLLVGRLPKRFQALSIPDGVGDGGLVRAFDEAHPVPKRAGNWVEGYMTRQLVRMPKTFRASEQAAVVVKLFDPGGVKRLDGDEHCRELDITTGQFRYRVSPMLVTQWLGLPRWETSF